MAKTGHPNFVYKISSPWRTGFHVWSLTGNHSGASFDAADAETFLTGAASPFALSYAPFLTPNHVAPGGIFVHSVKEVLYYDGQNSAPVWSATYIPTAVPANLQPTGTAYSVSGGEENYASLESCCELRAQVGLSTKSKPVFVRKFIHGLPANQTTLNADGSVSVDLSTAGTAAMKAQSDGSWFNNRVYISRAGKQPAAVDWQALVGARQMPRRRKKKPSTGTIAGLLNVAITEAEQAAEKAGGSALLSLLG